MGRASRQLHSLPPITETNKRDKYKIYNAFICYPLKLKSIILYIYIYIYKLSPVPVAARSKEWVCGLSLAGIVGSNPTGGMDVCLF